MTVVRPDAVEPAVLDPMPPLGRLGVVPAAWVRLVAASVGQTDQGASSAAWDAYAEQDPYATAARRVWGLALGYCRLLPPADPITGYPPSDLRAVIEQGTARLAPNLSQASAVEDFAVNGVAAHSNTTTVARFLGFLSGEVMVLNRYRQTWR